MKNIFYFTETIIKMDEFLRNTGNRYRVVSQRPYLDSNGKTGKQGTTFTLMITTDNTNYGIDASTGKERDNNVFENFEATILDGVTHHDEIKKGDYVKLNGFIKELSFVIKFDWILRFSGIEKIEGAKNA